VPQNNSSTASGAQVGSADAVASKVEPAIVDIDTVIQGVRGNSRAAGTGIVLTSNGDVLTNNHVVQGSTSIKVTFPSSGKTYTATAVGVSPTADVALVHIKGVSRLSTASFADSSSLSVGQPVVAIGNALGQGTPSVTQGTITALDQSITAGDPGGSSEQLNGLIESDASISPGDSGGSLVNSSGQVIGMITAGSTEGYSQSTNDGFAIPASNALDVINQIRSGHSSSTVIIGPSGYMGVEVTDVDSFAGRRLGLNVSSGALVTGVVSGSPADRAGITQDSVITAVDGTAISSADDLGPAIQGHKPGQKIQVTWIDQSGTHTASLTLASGPVA
jgi:S1-C subfamily serine protease